MNFVIKKLKGSKTTILVFIAVALIILFRILNPHFLTPGSVRTIFNASSLAGVLAIGVGCLFISGQVDLSSGGIGCLSGVLFAVLLGGSGFWAFDGISWPLAFVIVIIFGAVSGLVTSFFVNFINISAFIVTLAMTEVFRGLAQYISNSQTVPIHAEGFNAMGGVVGNSPVPISFVIMTSLFLIYGFILARTQFGRRIYVCGGNRNAARLAGVNPKKIHTILFVNNGVIAAFGGLLLSSRMQSAGFTSVLGTEFDAITAAVLGGIAFTGGRGDMAGAYVGVMLLTIFNVGLIGLQARPSWMLFARGAILVIALTVDFFRERAVEKALKARTEVAAETQEVVG